MMRGHQSVRPCTTGVEKLQRCHQWITDTDETKSDIHTLKTVFRQSAERHQTSEVVSSTESNGTLR